MVDEAEATGLVAAVYARILERMPMVPSLFKSFALCPTYLELAWEQTSGVLDEDDFETCARAVIGRAAGSVPPHPDGPVRELLARFVGPLSQMLLASAGLQLALDGRLDAPPAVPPHPDGDVATPEPSRQVPPTGALGADLVGAIRRDLATPIVNSIWRVAADAGRLAEGWQYLGPHAGTRAFVHRSDETREVAVELAGSLPWTVAASPHALERAGIADATPGMAAVVEAYLITLPRVLVLVAGNDAG